MSINEFMDRLENKIDMLESKYDKRMVGIITLLEDILIFLESGIEFGYIDMYAEEGTQHYIERIKKLLTELKKEQC